MGKESMRGATRSRKGSHALRKRCPICKHLRKFYEPDGNHGGEYHRDRHPGTHGLWFKVGGVWVCGTPSCEKKRLSLMSEQTSTTAMKPTPYEKLRTHFGHGGPYFLPVIHVENEHHPLRAARSIGYAMTAKADGVWLISHTLPTRTFLEHVRRLAIEFSDQLWIGVNCLGVAETYDVPKTIEKALGPRSLVTTVDLPGTQFEKKTLPDVRGIWADDGYIRDSEVEEGAHKMDLLCGSWEGLYFGGVDFKGQGPASKDPAALVSLAAPHMDVVTTSGPQTGEPPSIEKMTAMRAVPNVPIAIASGMTIGNIEKYLPLADVFMVASGISHRWDLLDASLTEDMASIIRSKRKP